MTAARSAPGRSTERGAVFARAGHHIRCLGERREQEQPRGQEREYEKESLHDDLLASVKRHESLPIWTYTSMTPG